MSNTLANLENFLILGPGVQGSQAVSDGSSALSDISNNRLQLVYSWNKTDWFPYTTVFSYCSIIQSFSCKSLSAIDCLLKKKSRFTHINCVYKQNCLNSLQLLYVRSNYTTSITICIHLCFFPFTWIYIFILYYYFITYMHFPIFIIISSVAIFDFTELTYFISHFCLEHLDFVFRSGSQSTTTL